MGVAALTHGYSLTSFQDGAAFKLIRYPLDQNRDNFKPRNNQLKEYRVSASFEENDVTSDQTAHEEFTIVHT